MGSSPMFHATPSPVPSPMFAHSQPTLTLNERQLSNVSSYPVNSQLDQTPRASAIPFTAPIFTSPTKADFSSFDFVGSNFQDQVQSPLGSEYVDVKGHESSFSSQNSGQTRKRKSRDAESDSTIRGFQTTFTLGSSPTAMGEPSSSAEKKSRIGGRQQGSHLSAVTARKAKDLRNGEGSCWPCCLQRDSVSGAAHPLSSRQLTL
jgi:hypothetical protein